MFTSIYYWQAPTTVIVSGGESNVIESCVSESQIEIGAPAHSKVGIESEARRSAVTIGSKRSSDVTRI